MQVSEKTVGRLGLYRRLLNRIAAQGQETVFSHDLARIAGGTAAQVRRDLMAVGTSGSPTRGYSVRALITGIGDFLDAPTREAVALVGVGNLGRAIMAYFAGRRPKLSIVAAFDVDPQKANRVVHGCRVYPMSELGSVLEREHIHLAVITVPAVRAQEVAERLMAAGVNGILNFAPVPLRVPPEVFVEDMDMTVALEKVAYYARRERAERAVRK